MILQEAFDGARVDVSHLRVFRSKCGAKVKIVNGQRVDGGSKLGSRTIPAMFIGYGTGAGNYILIDEHRKQFESRNIEFDEGKAHRTLDVGENGPDIDEAPVDPVPSNSAQSNTPEAPGDKFDVQPSSTANTRPNSPLPDPAPAPAPAPVLCHSTRTHVTTDRAAESCEFAVHEEAAHTKKDDWATNTAKPHAHATWDPIASLNAQLDDHIATTLMSANPDRLYVPKTYSEAMKLDAERWISAMDVEIALHDKKGTWELQQPPAGANVMASKWVYDVKKDSAGSWLRNKAQLIGKGFIQVHGIDYKETWAAVARLESNPHDRCNCGQAESSSMAGGLRSGVLE
jgi:hypothetical protein